MSVATTKEPATRVNPLSSLDVDQLNAVLEFRQKHGRNWKEKLLSGWLAAAYPGCLQQIRNCFGPEWLATVKESDFAALVVTNELPDRALPEMCFVFLEGAEPGSYVRAVNRGESGCFQTTIDETDPEKAKIIVSRMNKNLGVSDLQAECMLVGSMFGWDTPGADPVKYASILKLRNAKAIVAQLVPEFSAELSAWEDYSGVCGETLRVGVSDGGIVQVERSPFAPDGTANDNPESARQSILAALLKKAPRLGEEAEALGFQSLADMLKHQVFLRGCSESRERAHAYQSTDEAKARIAAASAAHGIPADSIAYVEPPLDDGDDEPSSTLRP